MAKRRKRSNSLGQLLYQVSLLAGIAGAYVAFNAFAYMESGARLTASAVAGFATTMVLALIFLALIRPKPKIDTRFDFSEASPKTKLHAATLFEYEVAELIQHLTGRRTEVVGGSGDGGIDIKVYGEDGRMTGIVQCKNLAPEKFVYPAHIRDLNTVKHLHQVNTAYLVSTGRFSAESQKLATQLGVRLIDGESLSRIRKKARQSAAAGAR